LLEVFLSFRKSSRVKWKDNNMMKIAFSTIGCPEWSWAEIVSMASDLGFGGIEIRGLEQEMHAARLQPFKEAELPRTLERLKSLGIKLTCLSSDCCLCEAAGNQAVLAEGYEYIDLAAKAGVPFVRLLGDRTPAPVAGSHVDDAAVADALAKLAAYAQYKGVTVLVETNGAYADTKRLAALLTRVANPAVGVLWDIHHPFRFFGEDPATTWQNIGAWVRYIHVKDSVMQDGRIRYCMLGDGDLPVKQALRILQDHQYDGFISLEWVKRWSHDLEDAAIVFPHFANIMHQYLDEIARSSAALQAPGTVGGQRLFDKDVLVDLTIGDLLEKVAAVFPDQPAAIYTTQDYTRTYSEFLRDIDEVAAALLGIGVRKGDHVAIWATNHPQWLLTFFATCRIGAVLVTVNTSYKIHEAEYLLRQSDSQILVMMDGFKDADYVAILNEICPELAASEPGRLNSRRLPMLHAVVNFTSIQPGCYSWPGFLAQAARTPAGRVAEVSRALDKDEVINMQYTSGTTGFPKGVMLTHYNILNNGKCIGDCMNFSTADRLVIPVPFFHCFGMVLAIMASVTHGTTMVPLEYFQAGKVLEAIDKVKGTAMHGVPTMFIAVLEHPDFGKTDFSQMRTGIMAGSPCPVKVMQDVVDKMHMNEITIVFGQTESSPGCTQSRVDDPQEVRVGTVGRALPGVECRIVDPATNQVLPNGMPGEFVARGYNIMRGYYKMPEATAAAIDGEGWLHTGDLAIRDDQGNYKITGRIKDMIIRGGENIYPKEIEDFLYTHPDVRDVQVVGVPDKTYGEAVLAVVIKREGSQVTEAVLQEYVRSHMAKHKTPKYIRFVDSFPMTGSGKIQKFKIREWAVDELNLKEAAAIETA
jgi:fatty-acyl-CoA synthase